MIRNILVLKPSSLGDVVHTLPAVALLKQAFPKATLRWLVNPEWAPILKDNPDVDEIIIFPRRELGSLKKTFKLLRWIRQIRSQYSSELVVDFQGLLRSALIGRACLKPGAGGHFLGLSDAREGSRFFYDAVVPLGPSGTQHAVERYLKLAELAIKSAGATLPPEQQNLQNFSTSLIWPLPQGTPPEDFKETGPYIALHPFSRGAGKSLSIEDVKLFCHAFRGHVVLLGRADIPETEWPKNVSNWLNRTSLEEVIWVIRHAQFVVSVDSGPMHIAAAITARLVSIHFWSNPALVGPYHPDAWVWKAGLLQKMRQIKQPQPKENGCPVADVRALAEWVNAAICPFKGSSASDTQSG